MIIRHDPVDLPRSKCELPPRTVWSQTSRNLFPEAFLIRQEMFSETTMTAWMM